MTNSESQRYQYSVCHTLAASFIQIPKLSERPCIVPHEVLHGLHVGARASLVESQICFYKKYLLNTAQLCWADENRFAKR